LTELQIIGSGRLLSFDMSAQRLVIMGYKFSLNAITYLQTVKYDQ